VEGWYLWFIAEDRKWIEEYANINPEKWREGTVSYELKLSSTVAFKRVMVPLILIWLLSLLLYIMSIGAYRVTEYEYSSFVKSIADQRRSPPRASADNSSQSATATPTLVPNFRDQRE